MAHPARRERGRALMFTDPLFAAFLSYTLLLVATPGATTAVVVRNTLDGGRRAGLFAAMGAALANVTHATVAGIGGAALLTAWPRALDVVRFAGGGYLAWLGLRGLWALVVEGDAPAPMPGVATPHSHHRSLREGLMVNLLGPIILTFYLAVVPTFIRPTWPRFAYVVLASCHVALAFTCHSAWAVGLHRLRAVFQQPGPRRVLGFGTSLAMLLLASRVLLR